MILTLFIILAILLAYGFLLVALFYLLAGEFFGAPFVPTKRDYLPEIARKLKLKKGQRVYDLGSGNGRIIRFIAKNYPVEAFGIEVNPGLIMYSRLISRLEKIRSATFKRGNLFTEDVGKADVVFVFLLSKTLVKLKKKLLKECKKGTIIVSHGFKFQGMEIYLVDKIERKVFCTYYYRL